MEQPTSQAKIDANRINSQKSTGPKTEAGKAKVSQNGTTHGLAGRNPLVRHEEREEWRILYTEMLHSFNPADAAEKQFFDQMFDASWSLRRIAKCEIELFRKSGVDPFISPDPYIYRQHAGLMRYKVSHTRMYNRAYKELTALQNHRREQGASQAHPLATPQPEKTNQSQTIVDAFVEKFYSSIDKEISGTKNAVADMIQSLGHHPPS